MEENENNEKNKNYFIGYFAIAIISIFQIKDQLFFMYEEFEECKRFFAFHILYLLFWIKIAISTIKLSAIELKRKIMLNYEEDYKDDDCIKKM